MTFQQAVQKWLDYKWPSRYRAIEETADGQTVSISLENYGHIFCIGSDGTTCLRDNRKDRYMKIVRLADPRFFKQLHSLLLQRR